MTADRIAALAQLSEPELVELCDDIRAAKPVPLTLLAAVLGDIHKGDPHRHADFDVDPDDEVRWLMRNELADAQCREQQYRRRRRR